MIHVRRLSEAPILIYCLWALLGLGQGGAQALAVIDEEAPNVELTVATLRHKQ